MYKLRLHYSVESGGDGSAYPIFMESEELTQWHQNNMDEGWGEPCNGYIDLESESPIICKETITTIDDMIEDIENSLSYCCDTNKESYEKQLTELKKMKGKQNGEL
ncbi:hypothetical protein HOE22_02265 [Candidatus Woesearchaeota archaeon]|nr:hypothetical protein [Candidatus Woesearchaeota archaeon]